MPKRIYLKEGKTNITKIKINNILQVKDFLCYSVLYKIKTTTKKQTNNKVKRKHIKYMSESFCEHK